MKQDKGNPCKGESTLDGQFVYVTSPTVWSAWYVVYHKQTKVMYVVSNGVHNAGVFTQLSDADGKPMVYREEEE